MRSIPIIDFGPPDRTLAAGLPECVVSQDGGELPCRYEVMSDGDVLIKAVKVNGFWHDPAAFGFRDSAVRVWECECVEMERDLRESA